MTEQAPPVPTPENMPEDSPESEKTIIRPRPGVRAGAALGLAARPAAVSNEPLDEALLSFGHNPILSAAHPLLVIASEIRNLPSHPNPEMLRAQLTEAVKRFERDCETRGVTRENAVAARYVLCTAVDECAGSTPWGGGGLWARDTLLIRFHNETWGGEKVFQLLGKLAESPSANRDLLELIYVCISLGFEGRFRIADNGKQQLELTRERLYQLITQHSPERSKAFSLKWEPAQVEKQSWMSATPFWAFCAVIGLLGVSIYGLYSYWLANRSDPAFAAIQSIRLKQAQAAPVAAAKPRLAGFLEAEIAANLVSVRDEASRSIVTLKGDNFFAPGSAAISSAALSTLEKIANALQKNPGAVLIQGHSDNVPIRSVRFPSNWELSKERALSVQSLLGKIVEPQRLRSEGVADSEPVSPNDTPANRAKNRRVEITLFVK
jgi:type VI secretion system protein ImpK